MVAENKLKIEVIAGKIKTMTSLTAGENKARCLKTTQKDSSRNGSKMSHPLLVKFWKIIYEDRKEHNKEAEWI